MINKLILTGNLGQDVEEFFSGDGDPISKFSLAFQSSKDKTGWIRVVCFKSLAEIASKYLHQGARIAVVGRLQQNTWENNEGDKKIYYELVANSITFIKTDGRGFEERAA